ncbi:transmembrane protein, putative [Medicago truncatula]|uniref:Transmembrane protein, putative n=1 Tax=Medicago truncatula TaxID=3880 RepID=G7KKG2_MEDTR|nr:transmembrane protein, putative [Medicago truncatula]
MLNLFLNGPIFSVWSKTLKWLGIPATLHFGDSEMRGWLECVVIVSSLVGRFLISVLESWICIACVIGGCIFALVLIIAHLVLG